MNHFGKLWEAAGFGGMRKTPARRQHLQGPAPDVLGPTERYAPMSNPPTGARYRHFKEDRAARLAVRYGVGVDDPAFKRALRNARRRERQA